jgi:alpha-glucosidase
VPWWQTAVVYQIYPRSFADASGDGVGDLAGIRRHLDHLAWLGVDAVWLSPIFRSPMKDFGYDVADYRDVDPLFGTLADLDALVADAHTRGLKVLLDWVPNHTSDLHPWFVESRRSRTSPKRDWYVWRDPAPGGGPPNDWKGAFPAGIDAWTLDDATGQYYLHQFLPEQPDLNWENPDVVRAMHDVLRFWLDRGIDGFRIDVAHGIGKDPTFPDERPEWRGIPHCAVNEHPSTHEHLRAIRRVADAYPGDRVLVGEVFQLFGGAHERYVAPDELHLAFDLPASIATPWDAAAWRERIADVASRLDPIGAWPTWVLSNHDTPRHRTRFGSEAKARAAVVLLLTLRGTPFLYAGEELGLEDADVPHDRRVDPGNRDGCRAPIPWDATPTHGWPTADPWLPWPPHADTANADGRRRDEASILHLYRRLLATRRRSTALRTGTIHLHGDTPDGVLAYDRQDADEGWTILVNFTSCPAMYAARGTITVASDGDGERRRYDGVLGPDRALLLRR